MIEGSRTSSDAKTSNTSQATEQKENGEGNGGRSERASLGEQKKSKNVGQGKVRQKKKRW